jgi:hypothetical protein
MCPLCERGNPALGIKLCVECHAKLEVERNSVNMHQLYPVKPSALWRGK